MLINFQFVKTFIQFKKTTEITEFITNKPIEGEKRNKIDQIMKGKKRGKLKKRVNESTKWDNRNNSKYVSNRSVA